MSYHCNFKIKYIEIPLLFHYSMDPKSRLLDSQIQYKTAFIFPITIQTRKFSFLYQLIEINISSYSHVYICWGLGLCRYKEFIILIQTQCIHLQQIFIKCLHVLFPMFLLRCTAFRSLKYSIIKRSARWLITPVWLMPSVRKHSLAVAREKGHVRDWQGRGATRLVGVTETAPEMGYFAQRGRGRNWIV